MFQKSAAATGAKGSSSKGLHSLGWIQMSVTFTGLICKPILKSMQNVFFFPNIIYLQHSISGMLNFLISVYTQDQCSWLEILCKTTTRVNSLKDIKLHPYKHCPGPWTWEDNCHAKRQTAREIADFRLGLRGRERGSTEHSSEGVQKRGEGDQLLNSSVQWGGEGEYLARNPHRCLRSCV